MDLIISSSISIAIVLMLASLSGLFSERSGVINIGIEGMMSIGALTYSIMGFYLQGSGNATQIPAMLLAGVVGIVIAMLHGFVCISLKGNQVISGTAINMLVSGICLFLINSLKLGPRSGAIAIAKYKMIGFASSGVWSQISVFLIPVILIVIFAYIVLTRSKWGLRVRSVGENPTAAESVGINVIKVRYQALLVSGILAGLAGALYVQLPFISNAFTGSVGGYGFLALGILIFGQWRVKFTSIAAIAFASLTAIATYGQGLGWAWAVAIPAEVMKMMPFLLSILIMVFTAKRSASPKALGVPYSKSKA